MDLDLPLASLFAGWAMADELSRRLAAEGMDDLRFADGVLFQHLVEEPRTIGELAVRLEISQQAASKAVADLERRGYVTRATDPDDARVRRVALTARGEAAIEADLGARLGERRIAAARRLLNETVSALGADAPVRGRRVLPPS